MEDPRSWPLIGFDARADWLNNAKIFSGREAEFLLKRVRRICSTDEMVWPSIFGEGDKGRPTRHRYFHFEQLPLPPWIGMNRPLWRSLAELRSALDAQPTARDEYRVIGITIDPASRHFESCAEWPYPDETDPAAIAGANSLLGFDVSDCSMQSGICIFGYTVEERAFAVDRWSGMLNDAHLFDDIEGAREFAEWTSKRVPEHAPFHVFALFSI